MRGGLDDALEKLARRDELRRRAAGEAMGTPPAVQDLVEAIATVVGRNPALAVTVGVEGAGDPVLLHFAVEDGIVQVSADNTVASRVAEAAPTSPRHADFDIDVDDPDEDAYPHSAAPTPASPFETGQATRRISYDPPYADGPSASHRRPEPSHDGWNSGPSGQATRRIYTQPRRASEEASATESMRGHRPADQRVMPTPLPEPVPLKVDTAETELAAKRLAALLRANPTLLRRSPSD